MGSEWKSVPFRELYAIPSRNGLTKPKKIRGEGYKFINMGEIFSYGRMLNIECDRAPATDKELETSTLKAGDLLFARQSLVLSGAGKCSIFLGDDETTIFESHLIRVRPDAKQVLPEYLYYYFDSPIGRSEIWSITEQGAGQAGIRGSDLETVLVRLPSLAKQEKIVSILQAIDNKIALNRQINTTLESMAQALFKSWFVDFDPVIDNALAAGNEIPDALQKRAARREALRQQTNKTANETTVATDAASSEQALPDTGLSDQRLPTEIQQLFPDRFVLTEEMGWVPEGWEPAQIKDIAEYGNGRVDAVEIDRDNYVSTENMLLDKAGVVAASSVPEAAQVPSYEKGSILISNIRPYFKKIWLASHSGGRSNDVLEFKVKAAGTEGYLYSLLCQDSFFEYMMATSKGTKMPRGDKQAIMNWAVAVPSVDLRELFSEQVSLFQDSVVSRNEQSVCLADLRDSLLPKLLSGQITIPDAEQQLAEVL